MNYVDLLSKPHRFEALTSLRPDEFLHLAEFFDHQCRKYFRYHTLEGVKRKHPKTKVDKREQLASSEEKLFFLLVYLKQNPTQEYHGASFGISQAKVSIWIKRLSDLLDETLSKMGLTPTRDPAELQTLLASEDHGPLNLDATERRVQRAVDQEVQKQEYSGKKKSTQ
ncbi:MAG: transposase family protein [Bacteroidetes bacterium]|nr:transposase family protein [Bacteroidota bacterium]